MGRSISTVNAALAAKCSPVVPLPHTTLNAI
jgi:hypothetical protein